MIVGCWLPKFPRSDLIFFFREANRSADKLARLGAVQDSCFEIFTRPPVEVVRTLKAELDGLHLNRVCPETLNSVWLLQ